MSASSEPRWSWLFTPLAVLGLIAISGAVFIALLGKVIRFIAPFL